MTTSDQRGSTEQQEKGALDISTLQSAVLVLGESPVLVAAAWSGFRAVGACQDLFLFASTSVFHFVTHQNGTHLSGCVVVSNSKNTGMNKLCLQAGGGESFLIHVSRGLFFLPPQA